MGRNTALAVILFLSTAAIVHAQDPGRFGVTMGYPAQIGVIWHVSDRLAVRPEVSFTTISSTSTSVITQTGPNGQQISTATTQTTGDQWAVGFGASALVYVTHEDALRTYVSPRFQYTRESSTSTLNVSAALPAQPIVEFDMNAYVVSGSFGAQYALNPRFSLYGELGIGYTHFTSDSPSSGAGDTVTNTWALRSGVGVILYFNK